MATGTVKVFKDEKKYGFIIPDDAWGQPWTDLFFYDDQIEIAANDRVEYTVEQWKKWLEAKNVKKIVEDLKMAA
jgi:cold shock CspA family protein